MRHLMFWEFVKNQNAFIEYIYILYLIDIQPCFGQKYIMRVKKKKKLNWKIFDNIHSHSHKRPQANLIY